MKVWESDKNESRLFVSIKQMKPKNPQKTKIEKLDGTFDFRGEVWSLTWTVSSTVAGVPGLSLSTSRTSVGAPVVAFRRKNPSWFPAGSRRTSGKSQIGMPLQHLTDIS